LFYGGVMSDRKALAGEIAARTTPRFIEIPRARGRAKVPFTDEQLTAMRGGLTAEEYRWKLIRGVRSRSLIPSSCEVSEGS
jgi:hypothetical protein